MIIFPDIPESARPDQLATHAPAVQMAATAQQWLAAAVVQPGNSIPDFHTELSHGITAGVPVRVQKVDQMVVMSSPLFDLADLAPRRVRQLDEYSNGIVNSEIVGGTVCRRDDVVLLKREEYVADVLESGDFDVRVKNFAATHETVTRMFDGWSTAHQVNVLAVGRRAIPSIELSPSLNTDSRSIIARNIIDSSGAVPGILDTSSLIRRLD